MMMKKLLTMGAVLLAAGAMTVGVAATSAYTSPAEAVAGLTGRTVEQVIAERTDTGKTYGEIADEAGELEAFKAEMLQIRKDTLAQKVESGTITQEQADKITQQLEDRAAVCDGTGSGNGLKDGSCGNLGTGSGSLNKNGCGIGGGHKAGSGNGLRDGSCGGR